MRSQNRKYNNIGSVSCLLVLLIASLAINPIAGSSAFAEESNITEEKPINEPSFTSTTAIASGVQIAFSEPVGTSSLTPISADGASALYSIKATVAVTNSGGYTVYLGSNKSELTGINSGATINAITSSSDYDSMPINSWGYSIAEGETAGTTFSAMPANIRGVVLGFNDNTIIKTDQKTFTLSFAAHIGNDKPADTYENQITMSVISSPLETTNAFGIDTMQEMTSTICSNVEVGTTDRLIDSRDEKSYWVKKMPDHNCWMVQNLDLELETSWPDAALSDYDTATTEYSPVKTQTTHSTMDASVVNTRSWDFGEWVITNPTSSSDCSSKKNSIANCPAQFTNVTGKTPSTSASFYRDNGNKTVVDNEYDAHYLVGNYYSWNTATAGTGALITNGKATGSICPKNWKLPTSNSTQSGSFGGLTAKLVGADDKAKMAELTGDGYFFVRGGGVYQATQLFSGAGADGVYWSSSPVANNNNTYELYFNGLAGIAPSNTSSRGNGFSIRCLAR